MGAELDWMAKQGKQFKIWLGVAQPVMFLGMTIEYFQCMIIMTFFCYLLTGASEWVLVTILPLQAIIGYVKSLRDKYWFQIGSNAFIHFGVNAFKKTRYVK